MGLKLITPVAQEPVTLAEARAQCRVTDTNEDSLISIYIQAARQYCEQYTQRAIGPQTFELALDAFPDGPIELPMSPATSITSVKYADVNGVEQTLSTSGYVLDDYSHLSWCVSAYGSEWPVALDAANAVKVRYVAGTTTIDPTVRVAMLLLIGHMFEERSAVMEVRGSMIELPLGVKSLLDTNRTWTI
jgi:uncharacterized phiE125 gp8 family phage protein